MKRSPPWWSMSDTSFHSYGVGSAGGRSLGGCLRTLNLGWEEAAIANGVVYRVCKFIHYIGAGMTLPSLFLKFGEIVLNIVILLQLHLVYMYIWINCYSKLHDSKKLDLLYK